MNLGSEIIQKWLQDQGLVNGTTWPSKIESFPEDPDNLVAIITTSAVKQGRLMEGEVIEKPTFEIQVRCRTFKDGYLKMLAIQQAIDAVHKNEVSIGDDTYVLHAIKRNSGFAPLGAETTSLKRREWFVLPIQVTLFQSYAPVIIGEDFNQEDFNTEDFA